MGWWIALGVVAALAAVVIAFMNQPSFGRLPRGARLERVLGSPNYRDGQFRNQSPTIQIVSDRSRAGVMWDFLTLKVGDLRPSRDLPAVKTDLRAFAAQEEVAVWLGHSSLYFQSGGRRMLVDPVFVKAAPLRWINKPFGGTAIYSPDDMPDIDYLIISHDHWDHLDYATVKALRPRTGKVVCPLGVGEHLEYWGFAPDRIIEMDWNESATPEAGLTVHCLPARHFSGRGTKPNQTLWASYMVQTSARTIYLSGDGGYDTHFAAIAAQFPHIDLAVMENGQYNEQWRYIHLLPEDLVKAVKDLRPALLLTGHNSKYALGRHPWYEPLEKIAAAAAADSLNLLTPRIGEPVLLGDSVRPTQRWWENPESREVLGGLAGEVAARP